jgi:hypothetical protein
MRQTPRQRGYDPDWTKLRAFHIRRHPFCVVTGCGKRAAHVDHVVPIRRDPSRRLDPTNLQSLCHKHHSILTAAYDRETIRGACDADGMPVDPAHPWAQGNNAAAIRAANARPAPDPDFAAELKRRAVRRK